MLVSWLPATKLMKVNADAPSNALIPMLVTLAGMVMEVTEEAAGLRENAWYPMLVTPDGIITAPVQFAPVVTTPFVIV